MILGMLAVKMPHVSEVAAAWVTLLETNTQIDPVTWAIYNAGAFGFFVIMLWTGQFHTKSAMKSKDNEILYLRGELEKFNKVFEGVHAQLMGQTIPNINQTAQVFERGSEGIMLLLKDTHDRLVAMQKEGKP